jgi:hypothetical protein
MVKAVTFRVRNPAQGKLNAYVVVKEQLNVLSVPVSCKHIHLTYFMQKVITSGHIVDNGYLIIWGRFTRQNSTRTHGLL